MKIFFSSFRNAVISIICAVVVLVAAGVCIMYITKAGGKENLDRNRALEYALADAGVNASDITITRQKLNRENGQSYYEIAFYTDSYEYEYEIDATSGAVAGMDMRALFGGPEASAAGSGGNAADGPQEGGVRPDGQQPESVPGASQPDAQQSGIGQPGAGQPDAQQPGSGQPGVTPSEGQQSGNGQSAPSGDVQGQDGGIGLDAAKDKALSDAGLKLSEVTFTKAKLGLDDGIYVYDIDFHTADAEYEYEINAATGAVMDKDMEMFRSSKASGSSGTSGSPGTADSGTSGNGSYVGVERAKEIAAGDAGVKVADAVFTESKLDLDDGIYVYDIDFHTADAEYDYKINAVTGAVVDKEMEAFQNRNPSGASGNASDIGTDRAKEIAAGHSGFQVGDVVFTKAELDWDDGCSQYEIEFCKDNMEYEYCIDASTGDILEYECDRHDYGHH